MTKEEYKKAASVINKQILELKGDLYALRKAYVESNSTIPAGTKVKVHSKVGYKEDVGILLGYTLSTLTRNTESQRWESSMAAVNVWSGSKFFTLNFFVLSRISKIKLT